MNGKRLAILCFFCTVIAVTLIHTLKTDITPEGSYSSPRLAKTNIESPVEVPLTFLNTANHQVDLKIDINQLQSSLIIDGTLITGLPKKGLPIKVIEISPDKLLVIGREMFSGKLWLYLLQGSDWRGEFITLPELVQTKIFRQAAIVNGEIILVLYDGVKDRNFLYRLSYNNDVQISLNTDFHSELFFGGRYELGNNILTGNYNDELYICSDNTCYIYAGSGMNPRRFSINGNMRIIELATGSSGVVGLFQDLDVALSDSYKLSVINPFKIVDLITQTTIPIKQESGIAYNLRYLDSKLIMSYLTSPGDLVSLFLNDWKNTEASGLVNIGMNNYEGRVAWSQVYYLNGFIDVLVNWENNGNFREFDTLKPAIKKRLDIEMALLDRLLTADEGLLSLRYSYNREPAIYAVQTGRILRLMKRYLKESPLPLTLKNYATFKRDTEQLKGHEEVFATAESNDPWLQPGKIYLQWVKGGVMPYDGANLPFNHQNDWASGVLFQIESNERTTPYAKAAHDIAQILLDIEGLQDNPPSNYTWHYWWGQGRAGWTVEDGISKNRPQYDGDKSIAHISYRTIDAMAVLTVGRVFPQLVTDEVLDYFTKAVENDGLYLFTMQELLHYGKQAKISEALAYRYLRMDSAWNLENTIWAYRALSKNLTNLPWYERMLRN